MSEFGSCQVRPSTLRFTHDSVSCKFRNGLSLQETFRQFLYDEIDLKDMRCLEAMFYNGKWLVVRGNRRLYLYKKLEKIGKFTTVEVDKVRFEQSLFERQYTSKNMGISIRIRGFPNIENVLNQITNEWRNTQGFQIIAKSNRRRRRRSKSRPRSGHNNAVARHSGQNKTSCTESRTSAGSTNQGKRQLNTSPTRNANQSYSGASLKNVNNPTISYKSSPTPSINRSYLGVLEGNIQTPGYTVRKGNISLEESHNSGDNLPLRCSCYKTSTPAINQHRVLTPRMYIPPPRSNDSIASSLSVNYSSSLESLTNDLQPKTTFDRHIQPQLQLTTRKDKNHGCCTIL